MGDRLSALLPSDGFAAHASRPKPLVALFFSSLTKQIEIQIITSAVSLVLIFCALGVEGLMALLQW